MRNIEGGLIMELFNLIIFAMVFSASLMIFMVIGLITIVNVITSDRFMKKYTKSIIEPGNKLDAIKWE